MTDIPKDVRKLADNAYLSDDPKAEIARAIMADREKRVKAEKDIDAGRFDEWSLADFAGQCQMQSRDQLDPEFSAFMGALGERLSSIAAPAPAPEAIAWTWRDKNDCDYIDMDEHHARDLAESLGATVIPLYAAPSPAPEAVKDDRIEWRFWNDKARKQAKTIAELRETLSEYVCACIGPCQAEIYGGTCGRAAFAALNAEGK